MFNCKSFCLVLRGVLQLYSNLHHYTQILTANTQIVLPLPDKHIPVKQRLRNYEYFN